MIKNYVLALFATITIGFVNAQEFTVDFEDLTLEDESYVSGSEGVFTSGGVSFSQGAYNAYSYSNMTNNTTAGYTNQYSVYVGEGAGGSDNFALAYSNTNMLSFDGGKYPESIAITNGTYAYLSMTNGDSFSKKFGGESGNDEDYFKVFINAYLDGFEKNEKVEFYLADYRFEDNSQDYIVDSWETVDLTSLGEVDSINFSFESTDIGNFGINTPTYVFIDDLKYSSAPLSLAVLDNTSLVSLYPNPAKDVLNFDGLENELVSIYSIEGGLVKSENLSGNRLNITDLEAGVYVVEYPVNGTLQKEQLIIQ